MEELRSLICVRARQHTARPRRCGGWETPAAVAAAFTPRVADRAFEPARPAGGAADAGGDGGQPAAGGRPGGARPWPRLMAWLWFFAFLAPTALLALASCLACWRGRPWGARLACRCGDGGGDGGGGAARPAAVRAEFAHVQAAVRPAQTRLQCSASDPAACQRPRLGDPHQLLAGRAGAVRLLPVGRERLDPAPARQATTSHRLILFGAGLRQPRLRRGHARPPGQRDVAQRPLRQQRQQYQRQHLQGGDRPRRRLGQQRVLATVWFQ